MPEYLAPGVYVEEIPGPRTIQAVSTTTAAFVGPTRFGPTSGEPELLTSYGDFVRIYGDAVDLEFADNGPVTNHLALGVKGFFDEGGSSLYVSRVFGYTGDTATDDHASVALPSPSAYTATARFPGEAGRVKVTFTLQVGNNVLVTSGSVRSLTRLRPYDCVWIPDSTTEGDTGSVYVAVHDPATDTIQLTGQSTTPLDLTTLDAGIPVLPISVLVSVQAPTVNGQGLATFGPPNAVGVFGFDPRAVGTGITTVLTANPPSRAQALTVPIALEPGSGLPTDPDELAVAIPTQILGTAVLKTATTKAAAVEDRQVVITLADGTDGNAPGESEYAGVPALSDYQALDTVNPNATDRIFNGLLAFEPIDDISTVVAPGAAGGWGLTADTDVQEAAQAVNATIVAYCENRSYLTAALDTPPRLLPTGALDFRNLMSSSHAALYYPWLVVGHPITDERVPVPPAAYMTGIWARSDDRRGVIKAPANEPVRSALDLELKVNKAQQELLNPQGVNCVRFFPGPGFTVWGARTITEDPEWKHLNIRRYFNYVEKSIDEGTQWVVFEINGPTLWDSVRHTVEGFLTSEWQSGALLGSKPEQGFFVECGPTTMTADDLAEGRMICRIGIAAAHPAEFVIFRISQTTATASA
jgi:phage tail sheath protein FI